MAFPKNVSPLVALDAVALDTETTGLDPAKARIIEVGAVRIVHGQLDPADAFEQRVHPGTAIPATAVAIHGIDDRAIVAAPPFADVWPKLSRYLGDSVLLGHTIGFDLAVLRHECERLGLSLQPPIVLDVRLLAEVAEPHLAGYSIDHLAAWLHIQILRRHAALADATTAGRVFCALVPRLRQRGIRTLGEAVYACEALRRDPYATKLKTWELPESVLMPGAVGPSSSAVRPHVSAYRHRVSAVMNAPAQSIEPEAPIASALDRLSKHKISSLFVTSGDGQDPFPSEDCGIITERDILRALNSHGAAALELPVNRFASRPVATVAATAFAYQAIGRMTRLGIRHLGAVDDSNRLIGALSARDLLKLRTDRAAELGDEIACATDVRDLAQAWARLAPAAAELLSQGLSANDVAAVISNEIGLLSQRAVVLAEQFMEANGQGNPPVSYAFLVLGSAARYESLLAMDQDNALVFADGARDGADRWFEALAGRASDILDEAGVPYCQGGVMAKTPLWRGSLTDWRARIRDWMQRSDPQDLLSIDIFFDVRGVHGNMELANELRRYAFDITRGRAAFSKLLLEAGGAVEPARSWWGGFRTMEGRIDLKKAGLFGIVSAARALAICHHVTAHSTPERLNELKALRPDADSDLDTLIDAHGDFLDLILKQQLEDIQRGKRPDNTVDVRRLSRRDSKRLRGALRSVEHLNAMTRDLLF
jgi:DNA polymerase-3 subunit epsilon/CBS domain-containing protein